MSQPRSSQRGGIWNWDIPNWEHPDREAPKSGCSDPRSLQTGGSETRDAPSEGHPKPGVGGRAGGSPAAPPAPRREIIYCTGRVLFRNAFCFLKGDYFGGRAGPPHKVYAIGDSSSQLLYAGGARPRRQRFLLKTRERSLAFTSCRPAAVGVREAWHCPVTELRGGISPASPGRWGEGRGMAGLGTRPSATGVMAWRCLQDSPGSSSPWTGSWCPMDVPFHTLQSGVLAPTPPRGPPPQCHITP